MTFKFRYRRLDDMESICEGTINASDKAEALRLIQSNTRMKPCKLIDVTAVSADEEDTVDIK